MCWCRRRAWRIPNQAKLVRGDRKNGGPITDGVFPDSKEFLAGWWIIDVENAEEAYKIAARASIAPVPAGVTETMPIEVREVINRSPHDCEFKSWATVLCT